MRSARYADKNSETERSDGNNSSIGGSVDRRGNNNSQFINYQTYPLQNKHGNSQSSSPNAGSTTNTTTHNLPPAQESPRSKRQQPTTHNLPGIGGPG